MNPFKRNINTAIAQAREDEKLKCEKDKEHALEMQKIEIEGVWSITLQEKEAELQTANRRVEELRKREKEVLKEKYRQRGQAVIIKHVLSELHTMSEEDDMQKMDRSQIIGRLCGEMENIKSGEKKQLENK
jgi:hypothetical protein